VFSDDIWPLGCGAVAWSDDQGATWTNNPASCGNPQVNDHQTLVTAKPHTLSTLMYPKILYRCVNNVGDSACAISLNGGLTFGPQVVAMHGVESGVGDSGATPVLCGGLTGHLAAAPDGTVYLPRGGCGYAEVAVSQDDGVTWAVHPIDPKAETDDHEVRVAVDEAGTAYATWNSKGKVVMSFSKDKGATWSQSIDVTAPGVTATWFTAIAAATPGRVAIAYIGSTVPGGYDGKTFEDCGFVGPPVEQCTPAKGWENATWNAYITILSDATSPSPVLQSATANDPNDPLARGECGRTRCHGMYDFIDLWIDQDGRPWASFNDVCTQKCVNDPATTHDKPVGLVATLLRGPALRGAARELPAILPQAVQGAT
jgi:hypothetical protein